MKKDNRKESIAKTKENIKTGIEKIANMDKREFKQTRSNTPDNFSFISELTPQVNTNLSANDLFLLSTVDGGRFYSGIQLQNMIKNIIRNCNPLSLVDITLVDVFSLKKKITSTDFAYNVTNIDITPYTQNGVDFGVVHLESNGSGESQNIIFPDTLNYDLLYFQFTIQDSLNSDLERNFLIATDTYGITNLYYNRNGGIQDWHYFWLKKFNGEWRLLK